MNMENERRLLRIKAERALVSEDFFSFFRVHTYMEKKNEWNSEKAYQRQFHMSFCKLPEDASQLSLYS